MKNDKTRSPYRTLVVFTIVVAIVVAVSGVVVTGINAYSSNALNNKIEEAKAANEQYEKDYALAKANYEAATRSGQSQAWPSAPQEGFCIVDLSTYPLENTYDTVVDRQTLLQGGMMLINHWHPLPDDATDEGIKSLRDWTSGRVPVKDSSVRMYQIVANVIDDMIRDAKLEADLESYIVQEGYRSMTTQQELFDAQMNRLSSKYEGDILIAETMKSVNYPGTSEYQSGFSFLMKLYKKDDTTVTNSPFQETEQGKWFTANAWKYGLIFRFPTANFPNANTPDKTYKTGISSKLNIYRYVGLAHSAAMRILGDMCLEEYIEFTIERPHFAIYDNGTLKYEIYRQPYSGGDATIMVPQAATSFVSSYDNMGGVITAYYYE